MKERLPLCRRCGFLVRGVFAPGAAPHSPVHLSHTYGFQHSCIALCLRPLHATGTSTSRIISRRPRCACGWSIRETSSLTPERFSRADSILGMGLIDTTRCETATRLPAQASLAWRLHGDAPLAAPCTRFVRTGTGSLVVTSLLSFSGLHTFKTALLVSFVISFSLDKSSPRSFYWAHSSSSRSGYLFILSDICWRWVSIIKQICRAWSRMPHDSGRCSQIWSDKWAPCPARL